MNNVKKLREKLGYKSRADFGEAVGLSEGTIKNAEYSDNLSLESAKKIADRFNVSLDYLFGRSEDTQDSAATMMLYLKKLFDFEMENDYSFPFIKVKEPVKAYLDGLSQAKEMLKNGMPETAYQIWVDELSRIFNEEMQKTEALNAEKYLLVPSPYYEKFKTITTIVGANVAHPPFTK